MIIDAMKKSGQGNPVMSKSGIQSISYY